LEPLQPLKHIESLKEYIDRRWTQMNADQNKKINLLSEQIIGCAYSVSNGLGPGFLEKVYENALAHELRKAGLMVQSQAPVTILYDGVIAGEFFADLLVEGIVLVELKAVKELNDAHLAQCLNYLKATRLTLCLLMNFARPKLELRRIVNGMREVK
jgi:GxxExxY protein